MNTFTCKYLLNRPTTILLETGTLSQGGRTDSTVEQLRRSSLLAQAATPPRGGCAARIFAVWELMGWKASLM